jgi:type I restriction enzyme S subunit
MIGTVPIAEVADINPPTPRSITGHTDRLVSFIPMSNLAEDGRVCARETRTVAEVLKGYTYFEVGDVLLAKITPCLENGKAAFIRELPHGVGFGSTEFHVLRPGPRIDGRYLFYMIWNDRFRHAAEQNMTGSAGQKRVPRDFVGRFQIPVPPLTDQRRIADILDRVDAIRRKREAAIAAAEQLLHGGFMTTVGPAAAGYKQWRESAIEALVEDRPGAMRTGPFGSDLKHSEFVDAGIAVLGIDNAVQNRFAWDERRFITPEKYEQLRRYSVQPGDVIITIMGTTGRSAVVPDDIPPAITTKHLATLTLDRNKAEPEFVSQAIHRHPEVLAQINQSHRGAIMAGLNLGLIKSLRLRVPPIDVQRGFTTLTQRIRATEARLRCASEVSDTLYHSLVQRAFRGEL